MKARQTLKLGLPNAFCSFLSLDHQPRALGYHRLALGWYRWLCTRAAASLPYLGQQARVDHSLLFLCTVLTVASPRLAPLPLGAPWPVRQPVPLPAP